jgi:hypothetical protein
MHQSTDTGSGSHPADPIESIIAEIVASLPQAERRRYLAGVRRLAAAIKAKTTGMKPAANRSGQRLAAKDTIYQIKIALRDIRPPIWRRVLVEPTITLEKLHDTIQSVMGWYDCHLHEWKARGQVYRMECDDEYFEPGLKYETGIPLKRILNDEGCSITYLYDFGDAWFDKITLEKKVPRDSSLTYPTVIAGRRACPPEDCGGIGGHSDVLRALAGEDVLEKDELLDWLPDGYNPEYFDVEKANLRLRTWSTIAEQDDFDRVLFE